MTIDRVISLSSTAGVEPVVVQQNDRESRTVRFFVYESSGVPLDVQGKTARIFFRKNGATSKAYEAAVAADGWISLTVPQEVTVYPGNGEMQLALVYGSSILHSFTIPFSVKGSLSFMGETETPEDDPMRIAWDTLPGKPDTFPPSAHTHTPAQAGALPANGTAADAAKLGGKLPKYYDCPRNLLDNSNFLNPVNQRGQTNYTGSGYTIDRWRIYSAATVSVAAAGLVVDATSVAANLQQNMETLPNGTFTFAAKVNGNVVFRVIASNNGTVTTINNSKAAFAGGYLAAGKGNSGYYVQIVNSVGYTNRVEWAALYEGEYTLETLPPYVPKGYAAELAECQRYYWQYQHNNGMAVGTAYMNAATEAYVTFAFPQTMRITPTISINDISTLRLMCVDGMKGVTAYTVARGTPNQLGVTFTTNSAGTAYTPCVMRSNSGTIIAFSADL